MPITEEAKAGRRNCVAARLKNDKDLIWSWWPLWQWPWWGELCSPNWWSGGGGGKQAGEESSGESSSKSSTTGSSSGSRGRNDSLLLRNGRWVLMMMVVVKSKWTADTYNWLVIRLLMPMMRLLWWQWWMHRFWCPCQVPKGANRSSWVGRRREQGWGAGQPQPGPARPRDQVGVEEEIMFRAGELIYCEMKVVEKLTRQRAERERLLHLCGTDLSWSQRMLEPLQRGQALWPVWSFPPFLDQLLGPF